MLNPNIRADPAVRTLRVDEANLIVRAVITTNQPDRAGDLMVPNGLCNVDEFMSNPVVLWAHQRAMPPIGTCTRMEINPDCIIAETTFSKASAFAVDVFKLYVEGVLRGWSIGFIPRQAVTMPRSLTQPNGGTCYSEWELLEYSAVPIPENPQALTLAVSKGLIKDPYLRHWLVHDVLAGLVF